MIYVTSDIHGCYDQYLRLIQRLELKEDDTLYILGDIVDRGDGGIEIIKDVMKRKNVVCLRGNHDHYALIFLERFAITDHNRLLTNIESLRKQFPTMELISGAEISAEYYTSNGERKEIHIVGLFLNQTDELISFLANNSPDIKIRFEAMLEKLCECGVDLGYKTYEGFRSHYYPERENLGRPQLAAIIASKGYASSAEEAMDIYLGDHGEKRAYVPNPHHFADIESVINSIHKATGVAILAHPLSYNLSIDKVIALIKTFKSLNGDAMEVFYSRYNEEQRQFLAWLATENNLLFSCASDFHGTHITDHLDNHFPTVYLDKLREKHGEYATLYF